MKSASIFVIKALLFASLCGCAGNLVNEGLPDPRPLGSEFAAFRAPPDITGGMVQPADSEERVDTLTLGDALSLALMRNPELASISWEWRAKEANALQERLFPNPDLDVEVENVDGRGAAGAFDMAETTILLSQPIETWGKRSKRARFAELEAGLAGWDYEAKRLDIISETTVAFVDVLAAQERVSLSEKTYQLSDRVYGVVSERVKAGKVSPLEESKASVSRSLSGIRVEKERRNLEAAKKMLASFWGSASPHFEAVAGRLDVPDSLPVDSAADSLITGNPLLAGRGKEIERRRAALALAKAQRIPDLTLSGGVRWYGETGDQMFVFGLSVPFPIFDRNQGGVREAEYMLAKAGEERRAAAVRIRVDLSRAVEALSTAHSEAMVLKKVVLPAAERAFEAAREGYRQGKFEFLEVLDAQKTFVEVRYRCIGAVVRYHRSMAAVERLIGLKLDTVTDIETAR